MMDTASKNYAVAGAISAVAATPFWSALVALFWGFPIVMVGWVGGDARYAVAAAVSALLFMTLFSGFLGLLGIGALGAGVGYLARRRSTWVAIAAGNGVAICAALVMAAWKYVLF